MCPDPAIRFAGRVEDYARARPRYPAAVAKLLARVGGLTPDAMVADIGSGTGLLSRTFLEAGYHVTGVEPNPEMRHSGREQLAEFPRFRCVTGTAEATTLEDGAADLAVAGQAFHWFGVAEARAEWIRILKPAAVAALVWNDRMRTGHGFMQECDELIQRWAAKRDPNRRIREAGRSRIPAFFGRGGYRIDEFPNQQEFDCEGLISRIVSSPYLPAPGEADYAWISEEIAAVFGRYAANGQVRFDYTTRVYWGRLTD
jgi:SAM-dependent methyltransferase